MKFYLITFEGELAHISAHDEAEARVIAVRDVFGEEAAEHGVECKELSEDVAKSISIFDEDEGRERTFFEIADNTPGVCGSSVW
jgi:hypothetical protein